jgi:conjugative transfer signal peptidase TraF
MCARCWSRRKNGLNRVIELASIGKISRCAAIGVVALFSLVWVAIALGLRYNGSQSFPMGLYQATGPDAHKEDLVFANIPKTPLFVMAAERGYLSVAYSPTRHLLKRLVGVAGDQVTIDSSGVQVNGIRLANSTPLPFDGAGRPLQPYVLDRLLGPGEILLMSDYNASSFDSRYFGPLHATTIESVLKPVVTWN